MTFPLLEAPDMRHTAVSTPALACGLSVGSVRKNGSRSPQKEIRLLTARTSKTRLLPCAFASLARAFMLFVLVGSASTSTVHAEQTEAFPGVAVQASEFASQHECCHAADQASHHADCVMSMCCSLLALAGYGGGEMSPASAAKRPMRGPMGFASRSHPPILHPPINV